MANPDPLRLATVVSAYYPIPSKSSIDIYIKLIEGFWPKVPCPLIFFTSPALVSMIENMFSERPGPTRVIGIAFNELAAFTKLSPYVWLHTQQHDPEKEGGHSPELYAAWYEKKEFVRRAIELNPFDSDKFVWCDAGIGRYPEWNQHLQRFPLSGLIPADRMLVLRLAPIEQCEPDADGIRGDFSRVISVGGGILASGVAGWKSWSKVYDAMLLRYYLADRFIGKDQNIMASMILENPGLTLIVDPPPCMSILQRWFYLLLFLAAVHVA